MAAEHGVKWNNNQAKTLATKRISALMEGVGVIIESETVSILSVDQPTRRTQGRKLKEAVGGRIRTRGGRLVGVTPATPGAPPRVLTGRLRQSIDHETLVTRFTARTRVGSNVRYVKRHELGSHPFLVPAMVASKPKIRRFIAKMGKRK